MGALCIVCYQATPIVEIIHILQLFLFYRCLHWGRLPWDSHYHSSVSQSILPYSTVSSFASCTTHLHISQCAVPQLHGCNNIGTSVTEFRVPWNQCTSWAVKRISRLQEGFCTTKFHGVLLGYTRTVSVCSKGSNHEIRLRPFTEEAHNQGIIKKKVLSCICMFITRGSQARKYAQSKSTYNKWRDVTLI